MTQVQSFIFNKNHYTLKQAVEWLKKYHFKYSNIDEKENTYRFRQADPKHFKTLRTITVREGLQAIVGYI